MVDLKPCPFCGSEAEFVTVQDGPEKGAMTISCMRMGCIARAGQSYDSARNLKAGLAERWNRRTPPSAVDVEWEDGGRRYEVRSGALWIKVAPDPAPHGEWHMVDRKDALPVLVRRVQALSSPTPTDAREEGGV